MSEQRTKEPRVIPYWPEVRVETGPIQFGNDWPGVFIRGDNALYYALLLRQLLDGKVPAGDAISICSLHGLLSDLQSCMVQHER